MKSICPPHRPKPKSKLEDLRTRRAREDEDRHRQAYFDLQDARYAIAGGEESPNHQIGGWPRLQQNPIWKECDVVSRGLPLGTSLQWNDPRVAALTDTQSDWRLLLQLDTDDDAGWMWAMSGRCTTRSATQCGGPTRSGKRGWCSSAADHSRAQLGGAGSTSTLLLLLLLCGSEADAAQRHRQASEPPLVMVHGGIADHTRFGPLVDELRADVTTFSMDRRGRGASGNATGFEDPRTSGR